MRPIGGPCPDFGDGVGIGALGRGALFNPALQKILLFGGKGRAAHGHLSGFYADVEGATLRATFVDRRAARAALEQRREGADVQSGLRFATRMALRAASFEYRQDFLFERKRSAERQSRKDAEKPYQSRSVRQGYELSQECLTCNVERAQTCISAQAE